MNSKLRRPFHARSRKGNIAVLGVFALVVCVGCAALAIDIGFMALNANRLQRSCDSAALAAASKLKFERKNFNINSSKDASGNYSYNTTGTVTVTDASKVSAATEAVFIAGQNGTTIASANVTYPSTYRVRVEATEANSMYFARIFGIGSACITRHATAEMTPVNGVTNAAPLGLTVNDYNLYGPSGTEAYKSFTLDLIVNQQDDFTQGDVIALSTDDTPSKSVSEFKNAMSGGVPKQLGTGDTVNSLNGTTSVQNAAYDGLAARLASGNTKFPIMVLPPKNQTNGTSYHVGTMAFVELISAKEGKTQGNNNSPTTVTLKFIPASQVDMSKFPYSLNTSATGPGSDIYVLRLVDDL